MSSELHEILGIPNSASIDEVHAAFRKKAREHHPDLGGDRKKFQQLNDAYEQLLRIKKAERSSSFAMPPQPPPQPSNSAQFSGKTGNPYQTPPVRKAKKKAASQPVASSVSGLKHLFLGKLPLQDQTTYFILVSALDIFITYLHLRSGNVEANPIANFFFKQWNISGMITFKLSIVAAVCVIAQIVALSSIQKASRLLNFGTVVIGCIVVYSIWLLAQ